MHKPRANRFSGSGLKYIFYLKMALTQINITEEFKQYQETVSRIFQITENKSGPKMIK